MRTFLLIFLLAGAAPAAPAQQVLCERLVGSTTTGQRQVLATSLTRLPGTGAVLAGLVTFTYTAAPPSGNVRQSCLVQLNPGTCDTLPFATLQRGVLNQNIDNVFAAPAKRSGVTVLSSTNAGFNAQGSYDSLVTQFHYLGPGGALQAATRYPAPTQVNYPNAIRGALPAPDGGYYFTVVENNRTRCSLMHTDSLGRLLWRRVLASPRGGLFVGQPLGYTNAGHLLLGGEQNLTRPMVMEVSQRGDTVQTRYFPIDPNHIGYLGGVGIVDGVRLRGGGFLLTGRLDTMFTTPAGVLYRYGFLPFVVELDAGLNVRWSYVQHRLDSQKGLVFRHPMELADGTRLAALENNAASFPQLPSRLLQLCPFSAQGSPLARASFVPLDPGLVQTKALFNLAGLVPLPQDSTFMLLANANDNNGTRTYVAHLRVPGLRRVVTDTFLPQVLATRPRAGAWPGTAYPNPAADQLHVPYQLSAGRAGTLVLTDALGRRVLTQTVSAASGEATLAVAALPAGLYSCSLLSTEGQRLATQRVAITR